MGGKKASPAKDHGLGPTNPLKKETIATSAHLPLAYMRILDTEAKHLGLRRNAFLALLLKRKLGKVTLERSSDSPTYTFSDDEFQETKLYLWYLTPEIRKLLDEDRIQMGFSSISSWITQTLNDWIGRPWGLRRRPR